MAQSKEAKAQAMQNVDHSSNTSCNVTKDSITFPLCYDKQVAVFQTVFAESDNSLAIHIDHSLVIHQSNVLCGLIQILISN